MSLLIKALDKAQDKAQEAKIKQAQAEKAQLQETQVENNQLVKPQAQRTKSYKNQASSTAPFINADEALTLSPADSSLLENAVFQPDFTSHVATTAQQATSSKAIETPSIYAIEKPIAKAATQTNNQAKSQVSNASPLQAANVFSAKGAESSNQNSKLALIAGAGLIAMLAMGVYYYQFVDSAPEIVIPPRPIAVQAKPVNELAPVANSQPAELKVAELEPKEIMTAQAVTEKKQKNKAEPQPQIEDEEVGVDVESTLDNNEVMVSSNKKANKTNPVKLDKAIASESASIQVTQSKPQDAINPLLMRAYDAYNAGNDTEAQKLYKQVMQRDSTNIDAMLGLGAVATRQGRAADANGWYSKVLSLEPRNSTAQAALLELQPQDDAQASESRIKLMLAKSPNDANLHAALGNLYAEQNQWTAAQQAYFDAFRLNASADNAFNLGVSLDQMGKPKLALPYYRQALQRAQSGTSKIDQSALEARIQSIQ